MCPVNATRDHQVKINIYNELLEDAFVRELELAKLKASLIDLKREIVGDAVTLDPTGQVIELSSLLAINDEGSASSDEAVESDSGSSDAGLRQSQGAKEKSLKKRRGSKGKANRRGRDGTRKEQLSEGWDYNLSVVPAIVRRPHEEDEQE